MWQPSSPQRLARRLQVLERRSWWTAAVALAGLGAVAAFGPAAAAQEAARAVARRRARVRRRRAGLGMRGSVESCSAPAWMAAGAALL
jgi:hypothetical protein